MFGGLFGSIQDLFGGGGPSQPMEYRATITNPLAPAGPPPAVDVRSAAGGGPITTFPFPRKDDIIISPDLTDLGGYMPVADKDAVVGSKPKSINIVDSKGFLPAGYEEWYKDPMMLAVALAGVGIVIYVVKRI